MSKTKGLLRRRVRWPVKVLRKLDRKIQRGFTKIFRGLYKVKFLRPVTKRTYRFVHYHHRVSAAFLLVILVAGAAIPMVQPYLRNQRYQLDTQARALLGEADIDLTKKLTFDDQQQIYQFNKEAKKAPTTEGNPLEELKSQVGGGGEEDEQLYSVDVPRDLSKGVAYYDNQMELSFKITPEFETMPGEQKEGHLIYPLLGMKGQLAYTVDASGMKENIVLYKSPGNDLRMSYKLDLPKSLEARLIPETGELGIYSADPALFGNISYGSSDDQSKIENARNKSEKTFLTFKIPAPVVMGIGKTDQASVAAVSSKFELNGDTLSVVTTGLDKAEYPLSIDPSVTVDSSSDFQTGNFEDKNLSVENGDLKRGQLTGGSLNSTWSNGTDFPVNIGYHDVVAYNGYLYVLGGWDGDMLDDVRFAAISSNGALGSWEYTTDLPSFRSDLKAFAYNGYMYALGGYDWDDGDTVYNDVWYTPINQSNGNLGTWQSTTSFATPRSGHAATVYNGYMYISGGRDVSDNSLSDIQYAPINANGTVGGWTTLTTALEDVVAEHSMVAYNNFMYRIGGDWTETVSYAPINADGTLGSWTFTSSLPTARYGHATAVYNGYLYVSGGSTDSGYTNTTLYAPINANGTLGSWQSTTNLPSGRSHAFATIYNGYFYIIGGDTDGGPLNQVRYAAINPAGSVDSNTVTFANAVTARSAHATVIYNDYVYLIGGGNNTVVYAQLNSNGTIGAWQNGTSLPAGAGNPSNHSAEAYNGRLYVVAGNGTTYYNTIGSNGALGGTWSTGPSYSPGRTYFDTAMYNGYIYLAGGEYCSGSYCNDVKYAKVNSSGGLDAWQSASHNLPNQNSGLQLVAYGGYLYTVGGYTVSTDGALYAPIQSNGDIGAWTTTNAFTTPYTYHHRVAAYKGYMYVSGGTANNLYFAYTKINANGGLDPWTNLSNLPDTRRAHSMVVSSDRIYIIAGISSNPTSVYYRTIQNGGPGTSGTWSSAGTGFTTNREELASVAYNGYLYISGGYKGSSPSTACRSGDVGSGVTCNDVQYAPLNANGTIGSWQTTSYFPTPRSGHRMIAHNGYLYVLGGADNGGAAINDTRVAKIKTDGSLEPWQSTNGFDTPRYYFGAAAYNGYMYIMGGEKSTSTTGCRNVPAGYLCRDIQYATIDANTGSLSNWQNTGYFNEEYRMVGTVAHNGYLYRVGGGYFGTTLGTTEYAPINSGNGSVGTWKPTTSLPAPRAMGEPVVANGYIYVLGGGDVNEQGMNTVQFAPLNSNGTIGTWQQTTSFSTARYFHGTGIYNGYVYVTGGYGASRLNDVQFAPLNSIPRKATYSKLIDLGTNSKVTNISFTGTIPEGTRNIQYRMAGTDGIFGTKKSAISPLVCIDSIGQYIQLFVTLNDSGVGTFPDSTNSNNAKANSVTVDSSPIAPMPEQRLRHGAWFSGGVLQPFDTGGNVCG